MAEDTKEKRKNIKTKLEIPVIYSANGQKGQGRARDITGKFAMIVCHQPLKLNTIIRIRFSGGPLKQPIEAEGEVVWTNQYGPDDEITPRGMRIKFTQIEDNDRQILETLGSELEML
ncbi:MAG TPA: PilZ domain-containing protein [Deltaproteobacteria bacterium]|nr:MAG: hypothetical protein DRG83_07475 [Deltaproteobacteria bacterium]RLB08706.1 MAG: hypothetical protein DRG59_04295 [Deltaproteobacteria bacterium]HDM78123.1 PilZ domain-containing protein [Deltaproteobacteria bacterium]HEC32532.1 PilZ domain-containing protein [Deltaproteobacteria bacterium]